MTEVIFIGVCEDCINRWNCPDASMKKPDDQFIFPYVNLSCSDHVAEGDVEL